MKPRLTLLTSVVELSGYHSCMRRYRHENSIYNLTYEVLVFEIHATVAQIPSESAVEFQ